ncbi:MAG TPA: hypothetical protein VJS65_03275, partial [Verrucomicrobiae bacterium]|nr:hypothetical protein [Verrucomicrobiae bacterium]
MSIPYSSIIRLIPKELWGKLAPAGVAGFNLTIARANVVAQLPSGSVKVKFGDVRKGAPAGVFINTPAEDGRMVELPLSDILAQLHPDSYSRRPDQGRVAVQEDVPDVFGANAITGAPVRILEKKEVTNTAALARQKNPDTSVAAAAPGAVSPPNVTPYPATPSRAAAVAHAPIRMSMPPGFAPAAPAPAPKPPAPAPSVPPIARVPNPGAQSLPKPGSAGGFVPAAPIVPLAGPLAQGSFMMGLDAIAESWPDAVRKELAQLKIPDARIALSPVDICEGLKRGRIQYSWRVLRSWIQPTPLYSAPSPNDDLVLELPLRTLTPAFLEFIRDNPVNRHTAAAENITEFFRRAEQTTVASPNVMEAMLENPPAAASQPAEPDYSEIPAQIFTQAPAPAPLPVAAPPTPAR